MHYYTYKITFPSGHWYIGKRKSRVEPKLDTKYNGSGKLLKKFMKNHKDFSKEIISIYDSEIEALDAEKILIGDSWRSESFPLGLGICLNLVEGGGHFGYGDNHINIGRKASIEARQKMSEARSGDKNYWYGKGDLISGENNPFYGRTHSEESKLKIGQANKGKLSGDKNPRFGVACVHKGKTGQNHPMAKMTGEKNANYKKKQYCDLLGNIIMADPSNVPEDYYAWTRWGFSDKELRTKYPKEYRGNW